MYRPSIDFIEGVASDVESFSRYISDQVNRDLSLNDCDLVLKIQDWIYHTVDLNRAVFLLREYSKMLNDQLTLF